MFWLTVALLFGNLLFAASTNDAFASRVVLRSTLPTSSGNFSGATIEPGEPHSYRGSLWWEWTPGFDGGVSITTTGTPTRPAALVYTGTWPNLTMVSGPRPSSAFIQPSTVSFYAQSNVTVYIALAGHPNGTGGTVSFRTDESAYSDYFSLALQLSSTNLVSTAFGRASTLEPGEVTSSNDVVGTFWWKWNLSAAGRFLLQLTVPSSAQGSPGQSPNLALYEGTVLTNLKRLAFATADPMTVSRVIVDLVPGSYSIAAEDRGNHLGAALIIRLSSPNDDFSNRIVLPSEAEVGLNFLLMAATREAAEPPTTNGSVWWEWTAPASGVYAMEVSSGAINWAPAIEVFQGTELNNLIRLLPAGAEVPTRFAALRAIAGQTYVIRVTAPYYASGGVGIRIVPGAVNDDFANAVVIDGDTVQTNAPLGASFESVEPRPAGIVSGGSLWWRWTPTNTGAYSIEASSADFLAQVNVYRGNALSELTPVTDYSGAEYYPANVRLEAGEPVYIQVIVAASDTEAVALSIEPGAVNDDFAHALPITSDFTSGSTRDATSEAGEPLGGGLGQTVWYRWQPTNTGSYEIKHKLDPSLSIVPQRQSF
ncbi:MAG TPA: hypothetical protein VM735_04090 [Candidatus Kapabacteria bacterium]|nr:hypothetical protein [Candidatus Kapabacteria bacterium]